MQVTFSVLKKKSNPECLWSNLNFDFSTPDAVGKCVNYLLDFKCKICNHHNKGIVAALHKS